MLQDEEGGVFRAVDLAGLVVRASAVAHAAANSIVPIASTCCSCLSQAEKIEPLVNAFITSVSVAFVPEELLADSPLFGMITLTRTSTLIIAALLCSKAAAAASPVTFESPCECRDAQIVSGVRRDA